MVEVAQEKWKCKETTIREVEEAVKGGWLKGLWKRKVREAGGEVVEMGQGDVSMMMWLASELHPKRVKFSTRLDALRYDSHGKWLRMLRVLFDEDLPGTVTREVLIKRAERKLWGAVGGGEGGMGIGKMLAESDAKLIAGEDVAGVGRAEVVALVEGKRPKWIMQWPNTNNGVALTWRGAGEYEGYWRHGMQAQAANELKKWERDEGRSGDGLTVVWSMLGIPRPERIVETVPGLRWQNYWAMEQSWMVGMRGSGVVAMAFNPMHGMEYLGQMERNFGCLVLAHAEMIERMEEWVKGEEGIQWGELTKEALEVVERLLKWRCRKSEVVNVGMGSLTLWEDRTAGAIEDVRRYARVNKAKWQKCIRTEEMKEQWTMEPGGEKLGEGLKKAVTEGVVAAGYVVRDVVWVKLPGIRFEMAENRRYRERRYEAGVYEVWGMWLMIPSGPEPHTIMAYDDQGRRHPHPHVYAARQGEICWGRTARGGERGNVDDEVNYGEHCLQLLLTKGWKSFVEEVVGFFSQWHDTDIYAPLCTVSTRVGDVMQTREVERG